MTEQRPILLATRSVDKSREIREILRWPPGSIVSLQDIGIEASPEEDGIEVHDTFLGNARAKAEYFHTLSGLPTLADDSGLCVDALNGAPGVRSRRFSGRDDLDGRELDGANNQFLLDRLHATGWNEPRARYVCAAVMVRPNRPVVAAVGTVRGTLIDEPRGSEGFGYDPLFVPSGAEFTFAEIDARTKHGLSHRGRAFRALRNALGPVRDRG